jgi:hypothetical protein
MSTFNEVEASCRHGTIPEKRKFSLSHGRRRTSSTARRTHMAYRPLGLVKEMLESMGLTPTYAYEDLVFVEHNAFLLQFEEETVGLHLNVDCPEKESEALTARAVEAGAAVELKIIPRGRYELTADEEGENMSLRFI